MEKKEGKYEVEPTRKITRPKIKPHKTYDHLTILVVANNDTMLQRHYWGRTKDEMAEIAIIQLLRFKKEISEAPNLSFALINYGESIEVAFLPTPVKKIVLEKISFHVSKGEARMADALETALYIASAYKKLNEVEGGLPRFVDVFLITDGNDIDKESTNKVVAELNKEIHSLFVFHIPSEEKPKEGYDYCTSLGHTRSLVHANDLIFSFGDINSSQDL